MPDAYNLAGKVALVTGATRGIGLAITKALAGAGATVVVCSRKAPAVESVAQALVAAGATAHGIPANVGRLDEAQALVDRAVDITGGIDILVNNAATNPVYGPVKDTTPEAFAKIISVNLHAPFEIAKRALPSMRSRGGGSILNIASIGGLSPETGLGIYSVSKAALISLTKVMAKEWSGDGIRANALCPGFIKTNFSAALWKDDSVMSHVLGRQPIPRLGTPEEVANFALFLVSDAASFCTGGVYLADGGYLV